jgi:hypothetical protein
MTRIGQGIAAGVAQHVSMDPERQLGALANGLHEAVDGVRRERPPALSLEDERTRRIPLQLAQHAQFIAPDRMNRGLAVLRPTDVQRRIATPFDLRPFQVGDFDGPQNRGERPRGSGWRRGGPPQLAAAINFSTSSGVRYSRVRISAFGLRVGTFRKMLFGSTTRRFGTISIFPSIPVATYG